MELIIGALIIAGLMMLTVIVGCAYIGNQAGTKLKQSLKERSENKNVCSKHKCKHC